MFPAMTCALSSAIASPQASPFPFVITSTLLVEIPIPVKALHVSATRL